MHRPTHPLHTGIEPDRLESCGPHHVLKRFHQATLDVTGLSLLTGHGTEEILGS